MTTAELDEIIARLRAGREFRVRNMDGEWGIRRVPMGGFESWATVPYEDERPPRALREEDVRKQLGDWEFAFVSSRLF